MRGANQESVCWYKAWGFFFFLLHRSLAGVCIGSGVFFLLSILGFLIR